MMRRLTYLALALAVHLVTTAQPPSWQWAAHGKNSGEALAAKVAVDAGGNTYAATNFKDTLLVGDSTYIARGIDDAVIARYDQAGNLDWSLHFGDTSSTNCKALAVDRSTGEVYIAGSFRFRIKLGDSVFTGKGSNDIYLAKLSPAGKVIWAQTFGSFYNDELANMGIDSRHNLVMGGSFAMVGASPEIIDSIRFGNIQLVGRGNQEIFIAKCDSNGVFNWAKNIGGKHEETCYDLHVTNNDNVVICGNFSGRIDFDAITVRNIDQGLFGGYTYVAMFDSSGKAIWAKPIGGIGPSSGHSFESLFASFCAADSAGNIYIGGNYTGGTLIFDATDRSNALAGGGQWLAKYSAADGTVLWTKRPGNGDGYMHAMCSDYHGNLYVTGGCSFGAVYGMDTVKTPNWQSLLVLKYDPSGKQLWMQNAGDAAGATGLGIAAAIPDEPVIAGSFGGGPSVKFGSTTCYNTGPQGNGFVAKLRPVAASVPEAGTADVLIYPNPTQRELHLEQPATAAYRHYTLFNALGQRVAGGSLTGRQQYVIQLPQLAAGVYYLELSGDAGAVRKAVSIQP